jgi:hypothetical protein
LATSQRLFASEACIDLWRAGGEIVVADLATRGVITLD